MRKKKRKDGWVRRGRDLVEYVCVRAVAAAVGLLPERLAVWVGRVAGELFWRVSHRRRRAAQANLQRAMPGEWTDEAARRLVRQVFIHLGLTAAETLWTRRRVARDQIAQRLPMEGAEKVKRARQEGRGVIIFTMHLGNWELTGASTAVQVGDLSALARPINHPLLMTYATRLREDLGLSLLSTREGVRPMIRVLQKGGVLAILMDQHVRRAFVPATFFGRRAATTAVVASLALRLDAPVFVGYSVRQGYTFRHRGRLEGPIDLVRTNDYNADVLANTQRFNDKLEEIVRRHPEQWLWTHRRWKLADREAAKQREESTDA